MSSPTSTEIGFVGKPLLRGVSHQISFFVTLVASVLLFRRAWLIPDATGACLVFALALANLFGTSALYHRIDWSPKARARMRRLDHAAIFVLIAGGYTPLFTLVPSQAGGRGALLAIWAGASVGILKSLLWPGAPKWIMAVLCVGLGWMVVGQVADRAAVVGSFSLTCLVVGGIVYSLGALVYALKRPDPLPRVFGYHEVFHALVVVASVCLFLHVLTLLDRV